MAGAVWAQRQHVTRPAPDVWSPVEYACHVRDVHRLYDERLAMMLAEDGPEYPNWDQDETAIEQRYSEQDPADVSPSCRRGAEQIAGSFEAVSATSGTAPADAATARSSRSTRSRATTSTTSCTTSHDVSPWTAVCRTRRRAASRTSGRPRARSAVVRNAMISARRGSSVELGPA